MAVGEAGKHATGADSFGLLLRVHAHEADLDARVVRQLLRIRTDAEEKVAIYEDEDEGIAGLEFHVESRSADSGGDQVTGRSVFERAREWLRKRSPGQFEELRKRGLRVDLCVAGFAGIIPSDLIKELGRLGLDLVIISRP